MRRPTYGRRIDGRSAGGQSLVEFALVLPLMFFLFMGVVDGGRAIFAYNGTSQAARNVARVASVTCFETASRCNNPKITEARAAQAVNLPGPSTWTIVCVDPVTGAPPVGRVCRIGDYVKVTAATSFNLVTPAVSGAFGPVSVGSTSQMEIQP